MKISNFNNLSYKNNSGFTLIEMIVVMAIFLLVTGAVLGIFISIVQQQKQILSEQQLLSQVSYVEEYMSKALRVATADDPTTDPSGTCIPSGYIYLLKNFESGQFRGIKFINQSDGICQEFLWDNTSGVLEEIRGNNGSPVALTSSNIMKINYVKFSINGSSGAAFTEPSSKNSCTDILCGASYTDIVQPRVTILLNVQVPGESVKIFQTTISQRNLNVNTGQR